MAALALLNSCDRPPQGDSQGGGSEPAAAKQPSATPTSATLGVGEPQAGGEGPPSSAKQPPAAASVRPPSPPLPPKPAYPASAESPPRPKRKLRKELEGFQAAWDKAIAMAEPDAFLKLRRDYVEGNGVTKQGYHVSNWDSMAEGGVGEFMLMRNPYDVSVEHGLAPWLAYVSDAEQPVPVVPGGLLRLKMEDAFEAPAPENTTPGLVGVTIGNPDGSGDNSKYSVGTPLLGDWPGIAGGSSSGWFLGTDTKTGVKKPYNIFTVITWFHIPQEHDAGPQKLTARLPWQKPSAKGLEDAEVTKELTLDFVPVPKPDNETLLCLWAFGIRLGGDLAKADMESKPAAKGAAEPGAEGKARIGFLHLAWADRLMKIFTEHGDPTVSKLAASLAAHPDWVAKVSKGYDPEMVAKMENLAKAAAELRSKLAKPLPAKQPEGKPAAAVAPADTRPQVHGLVAELANVPADLPVTAELTPVEQIKLFQNNAQYQWSKPELTEVQLGDGKGRAGIILRYKTTDSEDASSISVPTLKGELPLGTSHEGFRTVMTITSRASGKHEGYLLAGAGKFTFIWVVDAVAGDLPLVFPGRAGKADQRATARLVRAGAAPASGSPPQGANEAPDPGSASRPPAATGVLKLMTKSGIARTVEPLRIEGKRVVLRITGQITDTVPLDDFTAESVTAIRERLGVPVHPDTSPKSSPSSAVAAPAAAPSSTVTPQESEGERKVESPVFERLRAEQEAKRKAAIPPPPPPAAESPAPGVPPPSAAALPPISPFGSSSPASAALSPPKPKALPPLVARRVDDDRLPTALRQAALSAAPAGAAAERPVFTRVPTPDPAVTFDDSPAPNSAGAEAQASWPAYQGELRGSMEVRVRNPNEFSVKVGLRSGSKGRDFTVAAGGVKSVEVPNGRYDIYFQYSSDPGGLYQGDSFTLHNNGVEIRIVKIVNGNYGIRKVR